MKDRTYVFINGILNNPEDVNGWTDLAEAWIEDETNFSARRMEYRSGALTRRLFQRERVDNLETIISQIQSESIVLVGHSNGCDIIERYIKRSGRRIDQIHLIAAASEHDFRKNGFNQALKLAKVDKIVVYHSDADRILEKASNITPWIKWMGLGYGYMGYVGPKYVDSLVKDRVISIQKNMDHSQWFSRANFDETMKTILRGEI